MTNLMVTQIMRTLAFDDGNQNSEKKTVTRMGTCDCFFAHLGGEPGVRGIDQYKKVEASTDMST